MAQQQPLPFYEGEAMYYDKPWGI
jgi:hypothetical protein